MVYNVLQDNARAVTYNVRRSCPATSVRQQQTRLMPATRAIVSCPAHPLPLAPAHAMDCNRTYSTVRRVQVMVHATTGYVEVLQQEDKSRAG
jgi:hypothetical protein